MFLTPLELFAYKLYKNLNQENLIILKGLFECLKNDYKIPELSNEKIESITGPFKELFKLQQN